MQAFNANDVQSGKMKLWGNEADYTYQTMMWQDFDTD